MYRNHLYIILYANKYYYYYYSLKLAIYILIILDDIYILNDDCKV